MHLSEFVERCNELNVTTASRSAFLQLKKEWNVQGNIFTVLEKITHGYYKIINNKLDDEQWVVNMQKPNLKVVTTDHPVGEYSFIPEKSNLYVKWGLYKDVAKIIESKMFYPTFITGLTGNGKSEMVIQACANKNRECIRLNCTKTTGEEDFLGMYTIVNGSFVWEDGPVTMAMRRGAIVLLDEIDCVSPEKAFSLQAILEGKSAYIKKKNEIVHPKEGFNIIATANTKGHGAFDGKYMGTQIQNTAFLDRFAVTLEQPYPSSAMEKKILTNIFNSLNINQMECTFIDKLVNWGQLIRDSYYAGACEEIISTRRLINIIKAFKIFNDRTKAVQYNINTFDDDTKIAFLNFYASIDDTVSGESVKIDINNEINED